MNDLASRARAAHGDAWQVLGRLHGDAGELPGARLMSSGLPHPQWNNADVHDPAAVDTGRLREWYDARDVPWGVRVPAGAGWPTGRHLFRKRLMAVVAADVRSAPPVRGLDVRVATPADLDAVTHVDATAFDADPAEQRPWLAPHLEPGTAVTTALAVVDGEPVGTAYTVSSEEWAGPALYLCGVAVLPAYRRRGIAAALSAWLVGRAGNPATLVHLHPDNDPAARVYARLGFVEAGGLDVYVERA